MSGETSFDRLVAALRREIESDLGRIRAAGFEPYYHPDPSPHFQVPPDEWEHLKTPPPAPSALTGGVVAPLGYPVFTGECPCTYQIPPPTPSPLEQT